MTDAQSWTLIIGFLTTTVAVLGLVMTSFHRTLQAGLSAVRHELRGEIGTVRGEIGTVRGEIGTVRAEIDGLRTEMRTEFRRVDQRLEHLDRDVQALTRHVFDRPEQP